jgi:hypothetical protein
MSDMKRREFTTLLALKIPLDVPRPRSRCRRGDRIRPAHPSFGRNHDTKCGIVEGRTTALVALGTDDIIF